MKNIYRQAIVAAACIIWSFPFLAYADLDGVSSLDPAIINPTHQDIAGVKPTGPLTTAAQIPPLNMLVSLANGFPIWYQAFQADGVTPGLKLELCTDVNGFCFFDRPFLNSPTSFPLNFPGESFWWSSEASITFLTSLDPVGAVPRLALLVMGLEAGFFNQAVLGRDHIGFGRMRIRIDSPVAGIFTVTHPFGRVVYNKTAADVLLGGGRIVNETQDVGNVLQFPGPDGDWSAALFDGPAPPEVDPAGGVGPVPRVDDLGPDKSIGPFLAWDTFNADPVFTDPQLVDAQGNRYLGFVGLGLLPIAHTVTGSPLGTNFFEVIFIPNAETPPGFLFDREDLDGDGTDRIRANLFTVTGKIYNEAPNTAPVARNDFVGVAAGSTKPVIIDVRANDSDVIARDPADPMNPLNPLNTNVHGIHPQGISIGDIGNFNVRLPTDQNGEAVRTVNFATGEGFLSYTPPAGFVGTDTFQYVIQDTGGLRSALGLDAARVAVIVEQLTADAVFRPKLMKWEFSGTSSSSSLSLGTPGTTGFTLHTPLAGFQMVPAVPTVSVGLAALNLSPALDAFSMDLSVSGLTEPITGAHIHIGRAGENGTAVIDLTPITTANPVTIASTGLTVRASNAANISTMGEVISQIIAGNAYITVDTASRPSGVLRGQIGRNIIGVIGGSDLFGPVLGTAEVQPDGTWQFRKKLAATPGLIQNVTVLSSNGVAIIRPVEIQ